MRIAQGTHHDLPAIMALIKAVVTHMNSIGIDQWHEGYPNKKVIGEDLDSQTLFTGWINDRLMAVNVINEVYDKEYDVLDWLTPRGKSLYVHRLAVHPDFQKKGYARMFMDYAEEKAKKEGFLSVRLDTYTGNPRNVKFYSNRGYQPIGEVSLPYRPEPFVCFEKLV